MVCVIFTKNGLIIWISNQISVDFLYDSVFYSASIVLKTYSVCVNSADEHCYLHLVMAINIFLL